jgi:hypothetical protein
MGTEFYSENLKEEAKWGGGAGSKCKSEDNTKIGTSGNPQRRTQHIIPEDLNPLKKYENFNPRKIKLDLRETGFWCKNVIRFAQKRGQSI